MDFRNGYFDLHFQLKIIENKKIKKFQETKKNHKKCSFNISRSIRFLLAIGIYNN